MPTVDANSGIPPIRVALPETESARSRLQFFGGLSETRG